MQRPEHVPQTELLTVEILSASARQKNEAQRRRGIRWIREPLAACGAARLAGADAPEMIERVDPGIVAIGPDDADRVASNGLDLQHLERRLVHREQLSPGVIRFLGRGAVRAGA